MGRTPCCSKVGLHRGAWSSEEDNLLINHIQAHGEGQWRALPSKAGLLRCGKSCRLRWMNYLRPGIKRGNFTSEDDDVIIRLHSQHGNRWSLIATELPGRTDNEIKNYWNAHLRKAAGNAGTHHSKPPPKNKKVKKDKRKSKSDDQKQQELATSQEKSKSDEQKEDGTSQEKSKEVKTVEPAVPDSSSSFSCVSSSKNESSSSCTIEIGDADFDFSWSNWSPFLEAGGTSIIDGQDDECFLMDDCDLIVAKEDESLMFESLYHEYLELLDNQEDVGE
ncbi:hypothetical protein SSX86_012040 [Deinandra increscens subsp. villosa]|uniref:Uncharacterized protein n=1 Tax=Deinandra increscens subsp. villosa TaxID=3103831 RepID=A0AAP0DB08_9ASTR